MAGSEQPETQNKKRLEVAPVENVEDETCRTFVLHEEDHTLGNSLRYIVSKNPKVEFCGYSVPHPSDNKINFRIQTRGDPATQALEGGLKDLTKMCQHILHTFQNSVNNYKAHHSSGAEEMDTSS